MTFGQPLRSESTNWAIIPRHDKPGDKLSVNMGNWWKRKLKESCVLPTQWKIHQFQRRPFSLFPLKNYKIFQHSCKVMSYLPLKYSPKGSLCTSDGFKQTQKISRGYHNYKMFIEIKSSGAAVKSGGKLYTLITPFWWDTHKEEVRCLGPLFSSLPLVSYKSEVMY